MLIFDCKTKKEANKILKEISYNEGYVNMEKILIDYGKNIYLFNPSQKTDKKLSDDLPNILGHSFFEENKIAINESIPIEDIQYALAHEFGHFILHKEKFIKNFNLYNPLTRYPLGKKDISIFDKEADCFAANLLLPDKDMKLFRYTFKTYGYHKCSYGNKYFRVPEELFRYKLLN